MHRFLSIVLLSTMFMGVARAQEMTGPKAEEVKKEILKLELDKVPHLMKPGSNSSGWWSSHNSDQIAFTEADGTTPTKAEHIAGMRSGAHFWVSSTMKQDGHRVHVYDNGDTAVVTYLEHGAHESNGKVSNLEIQSTDVWVRQGGDWLRVVHANTFVKK